MERRNLRRRTQQQGESFDDYLVSLRELAKTCNFCSDACTQRGIRDRRIIEGLLDGQIVEDLLREKDLTLASTIAKCRAHEAAKRQRAEITGGTQEPSVQALEGPRLVSKQPPPSPKQTCPGCGSAFHPGGRKLCPAFRLVCHTCNKVGHLAKVCGTDIVELLGDHKDNLLPSHVTPRTVSGQKMAPLGTLSR